MKTRVISAVIALLITIPFILLGGIYFNALALVLGLIGMWELLRYTKMPEYMKYLGYIMYVVMFLFGYFFIISSMLYTFFIPFMLSFK